MNRSAIIKMLADEFSQQIDGLSDEQLSSIAAGDEISINFQGCRHVPLDFAGGRGSRPPRPMPTPTGAPPAPDAGDGGGSAPPTQAGGDGGSKPPVGGDSSGGGKPPPTDDGGGKAPSGGGSPTKGGRVPLPPKG